MRVLICSQFWSPEPAGLQVAIAEALESAGHDVLVLTGFPNYPGGKVYPGYRIRPFSRLRSGSLELWRLPLFPSHDDSAVNRALNYVSFALSLVVVGPLAARRCDVIYAYHPPGTVSFLAALFGKAFRKPTLIHIQDLWPDSVMSSGFVTAAPAARVVRGVLRWMSERTYTWASRLCVISPGFDRTIVERGAPPQHVDVVYNWADEDVWAFPAEARVPGTDRSNEPFTVMYAGNLGHFQGLDIAIRAAARLQDSSKFRLELVGTGQAESDLRSLAADLQASNVIFRGRVDPREMPAIVRHADIQLVSLQDLPFFASTIPGKTQAVMAAGRPMIIAVRGDAAELVAKAGAGIVCTPSDEDALVDAFGLAMQMRGEPLEQMGVAGRRYYEQHLSRARACDYFVATLTRLAAE